MPATIDLHSSPATDLYGNGQVRSSPAWCCLACRTSSSSGGFDCLPGSDPPYKGGLCPGPPRGGQYRACDRSVLAYAPLPAFHTSIPLFLCPMPPSSTKQQAALESDRNRLRELRETNSGSSRIAIQECLDVSPERQSIVPGEQTSRPTTQPRAASSARLSQMPQSRQEKARNAILIHLFAVHLRHRRRPRTAPDLPDPKVPEHDTRWRALSPGCRAADRPRESAKGLHRPV